MSVSDQALDAMLKAAQLQTSTLDSIGLRKLWELIQSDDSSADFSDFAYAVTRATGTEWSGEATDPDQLGLRVGQFEIDLGKQAVRGGVLTTIAAATLLPHGFAASGLGFVTLVLPALVEIERVELSASHKLLLVELRRKPGPADSLMTEDQLYESLPAETRAVINRYDFADFVARLHDFGSAEDAGDGLIRLTRDTTRE